MKTINVPGSAKLNEMCEIMYKDHYFAAVIKKFGSKQNNY